MTSFVTGWGFTILALAAICVVFIVAQVTITRELRFVRALTDYLGVELANDEATLDLGSIRDQAAAIRTAKDRAWARRQIRGWQMRAQRLEPALAFWVDLLRQLGLLFTVVGLGLALTVDRGRVAELLQPLSLAVWTTVAGLFFSIWLSARFGITVGAWADACEKNLEVWAEGLEQEQRA